jgi:hypothetical protein
MLWDCLSTAEKHSAGSTQQECSTVPQWLLTLEGEGGRGEGLVECGVRRTIGVCRVELLGKSSWRKAMRRLPGKREKAP